MIKPSVKKVTQLQKRHRRVRKEIQGTADRPRISVYRSLNNIYAQLVDDNNGTAIVAVSTKTKSIAEEMKDKKGKIEAAKAVGLELARRAKEKNVEMAVFDRGGYMYHGRVKAVADGAREGGLKF
jgi:large subunit ribosomal protein L18